MMYEYIKESFCKQIHTMLVTYINIAKPKEKKLKFIVWLWNIFV